MNEEVCVTNDHGYVPFGVSTSRSFPHSCLITGFVTRLTRWVPLVEQELHTLPEYARFLWGSCYSIFSFICLFSRSLFVLFNSFFFAHCVVCSSLIYEFWIPLWYFQTLLYGVGDIHFVTSVTETKKKPNKSTAPLFKFSEVSNYIFFCI